MGQYIFRVLVAGDIFINVCVGGRVGETLSGSAYLGETQGRILPRFFRPIIDWLFLPWETQHCYKSYLNDRIRGEE